MKKALFSLLITLSLSNLSHAAQELNQTSNSNDIKNKLMTALGADPKTSDVTTIRQVGKSDNYMVTYEESGRSSTFLYIESINSIVIADTGGIYSLDDKRFIDKDYAAIKAKPVLDKIKDEDTITFKGNKQNNSILYVFSDPTCGYCRKLHSEMDDYLSQGVTIKYLPFPRFGYEGEGFDMLAHAYCSDDRKTAFDTVKTNPRDLIKPDVTRTKLEECEDLVKHYYDLGQELGIQGTPAIYLSNGYQIGGYVPATDILQYINQYK